MVDNVCLYEARVDEIKQRYKEEDGVTTNATETPSDKESSDAGAQSSSTDRQQ
eukprot:CAMPEP_0176396752 /NCGR_PEP_ID=MMETSP0126-20121128/44521_1 /TAXON_ID=141414 ORGANISM="Strombidinopsis acuminatum, Strain SPMC142" /NCGR_SAMPLE_ID=MMETSP0126 /ASSEMBLY_ACC=CAM_ASM_000229 /LENGTH=52 /DNA_ID=CAMNT_0017770541 /DNA_START=106 /DNA_END=264 /DNA_ORIENTATION=+